LLKVFVQNGNRSSQKLLNWLDAHGVDYEKRYIDKTFLSADELLDIISFTENGFEDILSYRSLKHHLGLAEKDIESFTVKELVLLMVRKPFLIRRPFVIRGDKLIVGFD
jgi:Arsenate reductase and related proteins, glutaredoxin family